YEFLKQERPTLDLVPVRMWSGYGEPDWIPWKDILEKPIINLYWGWECNDCGASGDEKEAPPCPDCGGETRPKTVHWGGIHDWKKECGRLTFRYSAHPF
ncbi:MAG: hypothetical protein ABEJ65_03115, partial [bacterium]